MFYKIIPVVPDIKFKNNILTGVFFAKNSGYGIPTPKIR